VEVGPHGGLYLKVSGKPKLVNALRAANRFRLSEEVAWWRSAGQAAAVSAAAPPVKRPVVVYVHDYYRSRSHDVGAVLYGAKGFLDGIVDAGVLADDSAQYVHGLFFLAPRKAAADALALELVGR
jgi:hypothetical protein